MAPAPAQPSSKSPALPELARKALSDLAAGADQLRAPGLRSPPPDARTRQFVHGVLLPFVIARQLWRDPVARRRYVKVVFWQAAITVAFALLFTAASKDWRRENEKPPELRARASELRARAEGLKTQAAALPRDADRTAAPPASGSDNKLHVWTQPDKDGKTQLRISSKPKPDDLDELDELDDDAADDPDADEADDDLAATADEVANTAPAPPSPDAPGAAEPPAPGDRGEQIAAGAKRMAEEIKRQALERSRPTTRAGMEFEAGRLERKAGRLEARADEVEKGGGISLWDRGLLFWATLLSALYVVQTLIIWLSREYHDAIETDASRHVGVIPEDATVAPRVRINLRYIRTKLKRRWRAFLVIAAGAPVAWLVALALPDKVSGVVSSLWFAYWWVVFSAAKSAYAWTEEERDPWFLRGLGAVRNVPVLRWITNAYAASLRRLSRSLFAPAACVEKQPYALSGLALSRMVGSLPFVKIFLRPFFPVASALLIEERRGRALLPPTTAPELKDASPEL